MTASPFDSRGAGSGSTSPRFPGVAGPSFVGVVFGAAVQVQQASLWPGLYYAALASVSGLALCGLVAMRRRLWRAAGGLPLFTAAVCLAASASFGLTGWRSAVFVQTALVATLEGQDIEVTGQVEAMPDIGEDGVRFRFAVESARLGQAPVVLPPRLMLGWYAGTFGQASARMLPQADGSEPAEWSFESTRQPQQLRAGERWRMTVRLKAPHGNINPHGFDYELWLWEQGVQATGYVRAGARDLPPRRLSAGWSHPIERARQSVREAIHARLDDRRAAGIVAALVVGDQNAIGRADWDVFRATGVAHLMSISGLHITMFAWLAARLVGWAWRRSVRLSPRLCLAVPAPVAGAWGGLLLALLYALFSGWGVPAQRTVWMLATVVALRHSGRRWRWPEAWLLAMAVVCLFDPWALLQAGFWLSFAAVGVLFATDAGPRDSGNAPPTSVAAQARWHGALGRAAHALAGGLREQWVVTLALTPLTLLLFNQVSVVGLLANAVAIPWVTLVVTPLAMAGVVWAPLWSAAAWAAGLLALLLGWLASWPMASLSVAAAPLWCALAGVCGGVLLALRLPWHWQLLGLPLMLPVLLWQPVRPAAGEFELLAADIGQGNAVLIRTAGHALLYDTGPGYSSESDAGHRVLVPLLRALGERLDRVMLSHRDADHIGGAPAVLAMQPQADLVSSIEDSHPLQQLRPSVRCAAGQAWQWDGVRFEVLQPPAAAYSVPQKSNAMSCVLRIANAGGQQVALLVGDIESGQELALVHDGDAAVLRATVLLVPHHGSKTSSTVDFIEAVQPRFALAQAGYRNRFGHPAPAVVARYEERGIAVISSPACGAMTWASEQPGRLRCERQQSRRYWRHS